MKGSRATGWVALETTLSFSGSSGSRKPLHPNKQAGLPALSLHN
jgi:hypothetical protein